MLVSHVLSVCKIIFDGQLVKMVFFVVCDSSNEYDGSEDRKVEKSLTSPALK